MGRGGITIEKGNLLYGDPCISSNPLSFQKAIQENQSITETVFNRSNNLVGEINYHKFSKQGYPITDSQEQAVVIVVNQINLDKSFNNIKYFSMVLDRISEQLPRNSINITLDIQDPTTDQMIEQYWRNRQEEIRDPILFVKCSHCQHGIPYKAIHEKHQEQFKPETDHLQLKIDCYNCQQEFKLILNFC
jgi:hypothetical protein